MLGGCRLATLLCLSALLAPPPRPAAAQGQGPTPVGMCAIVERDVPPSLRLVGTIMPDRKAVVAAEVSGVVAEFAATEGQFLSAGDVICRLDAAVAKLRLAQAQALLAALQAKLSELDNGERAEDIQALEAAVAEADATKRKWEYERQRMRGLREQGQGSDKESHDTEMEYLAAEQRLAKARALLDKARHGARPEVLAQARHDAAAQEAVVRLLERDLAKTEVRAPFNGALVAKRTEVGEWIQAGGAVCELVALDVVRIRADVPEAAVGFAQPGAGATVEIEALGKRLNAAIARVIPQAARSARTFPVEIDVPNADHTLLAGMFVWAHVPSGPPGKRLMVSKDAIVAQGTSKTVYVLRPGPQGPMAVPVPVTTGLELGAEVAVTATALAAGDYVVCRANERLMGPTPVIPLQADGTPLPMPGPAAGSNAGGDRTSHAQRAADGRAAPHSAAPPAPPDTQAAGPPQSSAKPEHSTRGAGLRSAVHGEARGGGA